MLDVRSDFDEAEFDKFIRRVAEDEAHAYRLASESDSIQAYFPAYYGIETVAICDDVNDRSNEYLADYVIKMEYVEGDEWNLEQAIENEEVLNEIILIIGDDWGNVHEKISKAGIGYILDASVFISEDRISIVDVSVCDPEKYRPIIE